ncbi:MAG: proton-conducting transporter membrane subunit [Bacteroidota bacterium]|nr:proton-conducting transporter membrane subunit [Bacteroidota bacterium]
MVELINSSWILALLAAIILLLVPTKMKAYTAAFAVVANAIVTSCLAIPALSGQPVSLTFGGGSILGDILIRIDELSAWFILIINFTCITGVFYGTGYLKAYANTAKKLGMHWILFVLFQLSMVWVCMIQHGLVFLIAWEIMSLSSMMLVIFDANNPKTLKAGINYLVQMHISVVFLTIGVVWLYFRTGTFSFDAFTTYFGTNSNIWLFLVFFVGFGLKAGFIPFHSWLPHAHPAAPSHVSGVMSGVIVKLGIYGIFRVASYLRSDYLVLGEILIILSVLTGLYGILNAAVHRDFKRMLAYCTIENIGIIGIGIGTGLIGLGNHMPILYYLGFGGALLHVLNHSLFKSLLFYSAGSVYQQTHTRNMEKLGGLIKSMPRTAVLFLIGAIAIGGMPPFNGFISEFLIYSGLIEGIKLQSMTQIIIMVLSVAGLSVIGGLSIVTFTKTFGTIFLGTPRQPLDHTPHEVSRLMLIPQYIIIIMMLSISIFPQAYLQVVGNILSNLAKGIAVPQPVEFTDYISIMQSINLYSLMFVGVMAVFWGIRTLMLRGRTQTINATWGCGYTAPTSRIQYTGKSFSKSLGKMFNFIVIERKEYQELKAGEIFPATKKYTSHYHDFFEFRLIRPITNRVVYGANYFRFIQNGRVQSYVLYGIVFIIAIFLLTIFNIVL